MWVLDMPMLHFRFYTSFQCNCRAQLFDLGVCVLRSIRQGHDVPKLKDDESLVQNKMYKVLSIIRRVIFFIENSYYLMHVFIMSPFFWHFVYTSIQY